MILRQGLRLESLGQDLLSLASLKKAQAGAKKETVNLAELAASVLATADAGAGPSPRVRWLGRGTRDKALTHRAGAPLCAGLGGSMAGLVGAG